MLELMIKLNLSFTDEDRDACVPIISRIEDLSKAARKNGPLILDELIQTEDDPFLKEAVMLIADGYEQPLLGELLTYMLMAEKDSGANMLSAFVVARGVMRIGDRPDAIRRELYSMLGAKYMAREREAAEAEKAKMAIHSLEQFYAQVASRKSAYVFCEQFETLLSTMSDESIEAALKDAHKMTVECAIRGVGFETIKKIMDNLPAERQRGIYKNWNHLALIRIVDIENSVSELMTLFESSAL